MQNITEMSNKFNKKAGNFLDNPRIRRMIAKGEVEVTYGRRGFTLLAEKHLPEFFLWLSQETRQMVMDGKSSKEIINYLGC